MRIRLSTIRPGQRDENEVYRMEYEKLRSYYERKGVTLKQYIRSRRIDDGLEPVVCYATKGVVAPTKKSVHEFEKRVRI